MPRYTIRAAASADAPPEDAQLAGRIAAMAAAAPEPAGDAATMARLRVLDSLAVAVAAIDRRPVASARAMALAHPRRDGATLFGLPPDRRFDAEWAAFANGVAVRELDFNDTHLAADFAHPSDALAPLLAVAQPTGRRGADLSRPTALAFAPPLALSPPPTPSLSLARSLSLCLQRALSLPRSPRPSLASASHSLAE